MIIICYNICHEKWETLLFIRSLPTKLRSDIINMETEQKKTLVCDLDPLTLPEVYDLISRDKFWFGEIGGFVDETCAPY